MKFIFSLMILIAPVIAFLFFYSKIKKPPLSFLVSIYLVLIVCFSLFSFANNIYENYGQPPEWDFLCFWLDGKVAILGENFYEAKNYQEMPLPYKISNGFRTEFIDVGFRYPPFTMFLFMPLGLFDVSRAYLFWQTFNVLLCFLCIYGLWRLILKDYGVLSLLLIAMLMLRLSPIHSNFYFAQTNFLILLFFLLFWQNRSKGGSGIWLALCTAVKPFMALLFIYPILTRKWKILLIAVLTLVTITVLSVLAFGPGVFLTYLFNNPVPKIPASDYIEIVNQSLLAVILRSTQYQILKESPLLNPLYLGISMLLIFITGWVAIKKNINHDWVILSIVFLALIVYPGSLGSYSVFIIVPVVLLLQQTICSLDEKIAKFFIIAVIYFLSGYDSGKYVFFANIFIWLVCIILGAKLNLNNFTHSIVKLKPQKVQ